MKYCITFIINDTQVKLISRPIPILLYFLHARSTFQNIHLFVCEALNSISISASASSHLGSTAGHREHADDLLCVKIFGLVFCHKYTCVRVSCLNAVCLFFTNTSQISLVSTIQQIWSTPTMSIVRGNVSTRVSLYF